jgi:hypothetical protein
MIALVWFLLSLICVLVYIVMRQNWRINDLVTDKELQEYFSQQQKYDVHYEAKLSIVIDSYFEAIKKYVPTEFYGAAMNEFDRARTFIPNESDKLKYQIYDQKLHDFNDSCDFEAEK